MSEDLFATGPAAELSMGRIDRDIPYLTIDNIFANPARVREAALALAYAPGTAHYPGRVARFPAGDASLTAFLQKVVGLVASEYVPLLPPMPAGQRLTA